MINDNNVAVIPVPGTSSSRILLPSTSSSAGIVTDFVLPFGNLTRNLNVIFSFCREINGEKKNFCLVTNPRKKLKYRMFTEAES